MLVYLTDPQVGGFSYISHVINIIAMGKIDYQ